MILFNDLRIDLIFFLALILIATGVAYSMVLLALSRFKPKKREKVRHSTTGYQIVFVVPCLNEATVVGESIEKLLSQTGYTFDVLVIDDGSDDGTAEIVRQFSDPRVHLLQRTLPNARLGKGEALNNAYHHILSGNLKSGLDPEKTIICVMDADGRLEPRSLQKVIPQFDRPNLGAVQIGVRINNRSQSVLARMQDIEFIFYTHIFQEGRRHFGSVGLGGNGQFVRLSALKSLGEAPWSKSLCEDLDLGVRLHLQVWDIEFVKSTSVHQQGLVDLRRWVKQRTRWFQGHLQAWPLVPIILDKLRGMRRIDFIYHITSPYLLLVGSFLSLSFIMWMVGLILNLSVGVLEPSLWWVSAYALAFGPALLFGVVYHQSEKISWIKIFVFMHMYVFYSMFWYFSGWIATFRIIRRKSSWSKTERLNEALESANANHA